MNAVSPPRLRNWPTTSAAKRALGTSDIARPEKGEKPYSLITQGIDRGTPLAAASATARFIRSVSSRSMPPSGAQTSSKA
jgi:hypothetical protein